MVISQLWLYYNSVPGYVKPGTLSSDELEYSVSEETILNVGICNITDKCS